jgi:trans-2,3-dihydro-3-hydroxyanthranilate isomerase
MKSVRFVIADVFTEKRFGGNQLAVFTDAAELDSLTMQELAREMNYSETTFVLPPESGGDYRVRIFTPAEELPFAGHPIVGTAHVIVAEGLKEPQRDLTSLDLETGVGIIRVEVDTNGGTAGHTTMAQPLPQVRGRFSDVARIAKALSLEASDVGNTELPIESIYNGLTVLIVPVASLAAIQKIKLDTRAVEKISEEMNAKTVLTFTRDCVHPTSSVHCRVFAPAAGVTEDAATGSANGPLGFYLARHRLVPLEPVTRILSEQGYEMKRPSTLHIELSVGSDGEVAGVRVGGGVMITARGEMLLS